MKTNATCFHSYTVSIIRNIITTIMIMIWYDCKRGSVWRGSNVGIGGGEGYEWIWLK
jgi:hypothetical protein